MTKELFHPFFIHGLCSYPGIFLCLLPLGCGILIAARVWGAARGVCCVLSGTRDLLDPKYLNPKVVPVSWWRREGSFPTGITVGTDGLGHPPAAPDFLGGLDRCPTFRP